MSYSRSYLEDEDIDEVRYLSSEEAARKEMEEYAKEINSPLKHIELEPNSNAVSPSMQFENIVPSNNNTPFAPKKAKKANTPNVYKLSYRRPVQKQIIKSAPTSLSPLLAEIARMDREEQERKLKEKDEAGIRNLLDDFGGGRRQKNNKTRRRRRNKKSKKRKSRRTKRRN